MEESITVEVMLNEDNADDDDGEGGNGGFTSSGGRMFGGMGMGPVQSASTASANNQSGVVVRMPQEFYDNEPESGGARRKTATSTSAAKTTSATTTTTTTKSDAAAKRLFRRSGASGLSCSDSEDVSDVSSDVSSRLSPLTPSPDCFVDDFGPNDVFIPPTGNTAKAKATERAPAGAMAGETAGAMAGEKAGAIAGAPAGVMAGATAGAETEDQPKTKRQTKGFLTVTATDLSASSHAIDSMTDAHLQQQRDDAAATADAATAVATAGTVATMSISDERISIEDADSFATTSPVKMSLFSRVKLCLAPEGPPGKAYVMSEEELSHMTVTNILYFTGAVVLVVLIYVLYADAF